MSRNTTSTGRGRPTSVYKFYDADDRLLYIGITSRHLTRAAEHSNDKEWFTQVAVTRWEHYDTRREALNRERALIRQFNPRYNIAGTGRPRQKERTDRLAGASGYTLHAAPQMEERIELAVKLYQDGYAVKDIAKMVGLKKDTLYHHLPKHTVMRSSGTQTWKTL